MALQGPNLSSTFHMADNPQIWRFPKPETRWKFTDMIFEEKRWHGGGTEKGVLTSGASKKCPTPIWKKHRQPKCITWISFSIFFFWSPWKIFHTEKIGLLLTDAGAGDFPLHLPFKGSPIFFPKRTSLQFPPSYPTTSPLNTPENPSAFWTWKLDRQILERQKTDACDEVSVFFPWGFPDLGETKETPKQEKQMKGNEKSQEAYSIWKITRT